MTTKKLLLVLLPCLAAIPFISTPEADAGTLFVCQGAQSDVSRQVYVSNNTAAPVGKQGSKIFWKRTATEKGAVNNGTITLSKPLCAKGQKSSATCSEFATQLLLNDAGPGFECEASFAITIPAP